jgi:hypothetical protein
VFINIISETHLGGGGGTVFRTKYKPLCLAKKKKLHKKKEKIPKVREACFTSTVDEPVPIHSEGKNIADMRCFAADPDPTLNLILISYK